MRSFIIYSVHQILLGEGEMRGHVVHMGEMRNAYKILVRRPEGKRSLGRQRHRWKDNIKMDFKYSGVRLWIVSG
jgi:hypothetical protein